MSNLVNRWFEPLRVKHRHSVRPRLEEVLPRECPAGPGAVFWDRASDGDGDNYLAEDPLNWSTNQVPGPTNQVFIDNWTGNIGFLANHTFGSLHFNSPGATIQGGGNLTIAGAFDWKAGAIFGNGSLTLQGTSQFNANAGQDLRLDARQVFNSGQIIWTSGWIQMTSGAEITNNAGALFSIQTDDDITLPVGAIGTEMFTNLGTINKSGAVDDKTTIACLLDNVGPTGSVNVLSGELQLFNDGDHSGPFTAQAGTRLKFSFGTHTLSQGTVFQGEGWIVADGFADLNIPTQTVVYNLGNFELAAWLKGSGVAGAAGKFSNQNRFRWSDGGMEDVKFQNGGVLAGAQMEIEDNTTLKVFESSLLTNYATVKWNAGDITRKRTNGTSYIDNYGLWEAASDNAILDGGGLFDMAFYNQINQQTGAKGVFSKTGGAGGETEFLVRLHNAGIINKNGRNITWDPAHYTGDGEVNN